MSEYTVTVSGGTVTIATVGTVGPTGATGTTGVESGTSTFTGFGSSGRTITFSTPMADTNYDVHIVLLGLSDEERFQVRSVGEIAVPDSQKTVNGFRVDSPDYLIGKSFRWTVYKYST